MGWASSSEMIAGAEAGARSLGVTSRDVVDSLCCRGGKVLRGGGAAGWENDRGPVVNGVCSVGDEFPFPGGVGGERAGAWALIGNNGTGDQLLSRHTQADLLMGAVAPSSPRQPLTSQCRLKASLRENLIISKIRPSTVATYVFPHLSQPKGLTARWILLCRFRS